MNLLISYQIENLISRGVSILNGLDSELQQQNAPSVHVARDVIADGAGALAAELFGTKATKYGKKATKIWLENQKKDSIKIINNKYYQQYVAWFQDVRTFVSSLSINSPRVVFPGNSGTLINKLGKAEGFKNLRTRIRHVITQLEELRVQDLVLNVSLPKQLEPPKESVGKFEPSEALHQLENALRKFIERELSKTDSDWWNTRVPFDIRSRAEGRKRTRESIWPWYPPTSANIMDYLDFSDYRKIILDMTNWDLVFKSRFESRVFLESRLTELEPIRHDLAHSRVLSKMAKDKLRIFVDELCVCCNKAA